MARRIGTIAGALCACAMFLECTARAYLFGLAGLHPLRVDSVRPVLQTDILASSNDPEIGFELRPNLDIWFKLVHFRTNSRGLRYREVELRKPVGTFRVAVMGSSFTLPAGVELEDAFHARLERHFSKISGRSVGFINFSVGAFHPAQNFAVLEKRAMEYEPDLVLFSLTKMGARAALSQEPAQAVLPQARRHPFFESFLWKLAKARSGIHKSPMELRFAPPVAPGRRVPSVIERLGEFAARTNLPVVIVRLEYKAQTESAMDQRLRSEAIQRGLHYVDTRGPFRGIDTRRFWIYELDPHPNAQAHAVFAEVIGEYLADAELIPAVRTNSVHHHE